MNLRDTQPTSKLNIDSLKINVNDFLLVFRKRYPDNFWRVSIVTQVLPNTDFLKKRRNSETGKTIFKSPTNKLFAVENTYHGTNQTNKASHNKIASPSPAILWIVNTRGRKPGYKKVNSALQKARTEFLNMVCEECLNVLSLLYIHREIFLGYDKIINIYASKYPRRMLLTNLLSEN